jgi:hypothetical protein
VIGSLSPQFGVRLVIDGAAVEPPALGRAFTVDERPHTFVFTCEKDLCEPRSIAIAGGEADETIPVELRILPAKLVIEGDPTRSYGIEHKPQLTLAPGVATEIPVRGGSEDVIVYDRGDPTNHREVKLEAGQVKRVS